MKIIHTTKDLADLCHELQVQDANGFLTIDTEFVREDTYWPNLGLIQIAGSCQEAIVDPVSGGKDLDLKPFFELMQNPAITKVFHAARQDLEIFYHLDSRLPKNLFDTQIGAMVCGHGESVSYDSLVQALLGKTIDKSHRYTNWLRRPLSDAQISYAIKDVTYLRAVYKQLIEKINSLDRMSWIEQELKTLLDPSIYDSDPMELWKKIKSRNDSSAYLVVLQYLAALRDQFAREKNIPRSRVLKDQVLLDLAAMRPKSMSDLEKLRGIGNMKNSSLGPRILEAIEKAVSAPEHQWPKRKKSKKHNLSGPLADLLKLYLKQVSLDSGVAASIIATSEDIEKIFDQQDAPAFMQGWRYELFGKGALDLANGVKRIRVRKNKLVLD